MWWQLGGRGELGRLGGFGGVGGVSLRGNQPNSAAGGGEKKEKGTPLVSVMSGQRRRRAGGLELSGTREKERERAPIQACSTAGETS